MTLHSVIKQTRHPLFFKKITPELRKELFTTGKQLFGIELIFRPVDIRVKCDAETCVKVKSWVREQMCPRTIQLPSEFKTCSSFFFTLLKS